MTEKLAQVMQVVANATGLEIKPDSMSAARFVTHMRYLFIRLESGKQITDSPPVLMTAVREAHPQAYHCAQRIRYLLEIGGARLTEDEVLYLSLHVARLVADLR